ncbi:MAG: Glutaredoxin [Syntrophus sp. PtaU1.Bin005]|jgi:glutaredoxin 3|uniref:UXX-star selenoprotein family 1 n=1 Tax=Syntrophus sp. (in: bacteria) TaxID=48412 RepID=UPI0009D3CE0B|nr:MAG: Glutaredoxin [Syntrophus sp. PtaB.Bin138]OPY77460.1 MAG: Glutaredoxin [Syntrophus sp. PtaU1.Bin005]
MSGDKIRIYGTDTCPFTRQARATYKEKAIFINVADDQDKLDEMLAYSGGKRIIPVIVDGGKVTVGFSPDGGSGGG